MATPDGRVDSEGGRENADTDGDHVDLVREEIRDRCIRLLTEAGEPTQPFGLYVFPASSADSDLARFVENSVFAEWFGNTPQMLAEEYSPFDEASIFLCVVDHERRLPAGAMRLILPSSAGFKTFQDLHEVWNVDLEMLGREHGLHFDRDHTMDVTTIAVMPEYRGAATDGLVTLALLQGMSVLFRMSSTRWAVSVMDLAALERVQDLIGRPCQLFPGVEPRGYLDSPASVPIFVDIEEYFARLADADPVMLEMSEGRGLESVVHPPEWPQTVRRDSRASATTGSARNDAADR